MICRWNNHWFHGPSFDVGDPLFDLHQESYDIPTCHSKPDASELHLSCLEVRGEVDELHEDLPTDVPQDEDLDDLPSRDLLLELPGLREAPELRDLHQSSTDHGQESDLRELPLDLLLGVPGHAVGGHELLEAEDLPQGLMGS